MRMPKGGRKEDGFRATGKKAPAVPDRDQEERWSEALREAKQSVFEIFEDRGPGVAVPPAGLARRDEHGRR
jgi:hypothetical protein